MAEWSSIVVPELAELDQFALGMTIGEVKARYGLDEVVKLSWNENLFGPLPGLLEAVHAELENVWLYPEQPYIDFRNEVAASIGASPTNVVPAHGSLALLGHVASLLLRPGAHVVAPELTYGLYAQISATRGATVHRVPMQGLAIDLGALAETAQRVDARIVWICDPNNPTGALLVQAEWNAFLEALPDRCVAVVDEAYADFISPDGRVRREDDVLGGRRVIVLRSFSKLFGLAGLRLGYAVVDEDLVPYFDLIEEPYNVNCAALAAGCACLRAPEAVVERREEVATARAALSDGLRAAELEPLPSVTNFVLARLDVDDAVLADRLAERGLLIRPGSDYGLPGYARITVGPIPLMERVCVELAEVCASLRG
ncbi:MAG: pyridoxal phosphate-dependent aminotransferase [Gaiellaceae bacterium]